MNLVQMVTDAALAERDDEYLHPSELGGCIRASMLRISHATHRAPDPKEQWRLARYGSYEHYVEQGLRHAGVPFWAQVSLEFLGWKGTIDFLTAESGEYQGEVCLIEVKSVKEKGLKYAPYPQHKLQIWTYWTMMNSKPDAAILFYITRWYDDVPQMVQFDVTPTDEDLQELAIHTRRFVEAKYNLPSLPEVPFATPVEHPYLCTLYGKPNCRYIEHCWPGLEVKEELPF